MALITASDAKFCAAMWIAYQPSWSAARVVSADTNASTFSSLSPASKASIKAACSILAEAQIWALVQTEPLEPHFHAHLEGLLSQLGLGQPPARWRLLRLLLGTGDGAARR